MKALQLFVYRYWVFIVVGCVMQKKAIDAAYFERGFLAVGGEWLIAPVMVMFAIVLRNLFSIVAETFLEDRYAKVSKRYRRKIQR